MQKFQNMEHLNSMTFQGLSRAWIFFFKIQGLLKDPMNPETLNFELPVCEILQHIAKCLCFDGPQNTFWMVDFQENYC